MPSLNRPDMLVLAAGGILGEAWMSGVLAGIEDGTRIDFRACEAFVGTSAGAIVAARLAAGERPRRPRGEGADPGFAASAGDVDESPVPQGSDVVRGLARGAARVGALATAPLVPTAVALGTPVSARVRALALARVPDRGRSLGPLRSEIARLKLRFDGRLRVCTVDKETGRRVVFGRPGSPQAEVADAVVASCSIPWVFKPVKIGGRRYVDGGAWSLTNLDVVPAGREAEVLCLNPSSSLGMAFASPFGLVRAAAGVAAELEAVTVRGRGARVRVLGPDAETAAVMGANFMDARPAGAVLAAGYRQGRALAG